MRSRSSLKNRHWVCFGYVAGSRMSKKFYPIEPLDDGCVLGKKATGKNAYWYVRMYWKDRGESEYRSTKILYEDSRAHLRETNRSYLEPESHPKLGGSCLAWRHSFQ